MHTFNLFVDEPHDVSFRLVKDFVPANVVLLDRLVHGLAYHLLDLEIVPSAQLLILIAQVAHHLGAFLLDSADFGFIIDGNSVNILHVSDEFLISTGIGVGQL